MVITDGRQGFGVKLVLTVLVVILILLQLRLWKGTGSLEDINTMDQRIETQQRDNAVLTERNEVLREEVSDLKNGQDSIEERARSELGLIKKGETFFLIIENETAPVAGFENPEPEPENLDIIQ